MQAIVTQGSTDGVWATVTRLDGDPRIKKMAIGIDQKCVNFSIQAIL